MKITKRQLQQIIKEELQAALKEGGAQGHMPSIDPRSVRALKQPFVKLNNAFLFRDPELGPAEVHAKDLETAANQLSLPGHVMDAVYDVIDAVYAGDSLKFTAAKEAFQEMLSAGDVGFGAT